MSARTDTYLQDDDGHVAGSEGLYTVLRIGNLCCGSPYPVLYFDDGREACAGCFRVLRHADACDCSECEAQRFADDAADASTNHGKA